MYPGGDFGIHGNENESSVGWNSSHGCIRMHNEEIKELYKIIPIGTKVTIIDGLYREFGRGFRTLKSGMYGSDVLQIQKRLKELNCFFGEPNGIFGGETETAIKKYCKDNKLYQTKIITPDLQKKMGFELID